LKVYRFLKLTLLRNIEQNLAASLEILHHHLWRGNPPKCPI